MKSGFFKQLFPNYNTQNVEQSNDSDNVIDNSQENEYNDIYDPFTNSFDWFDPLSMDY